MALCNEFYRHLARAFSDCPCHFPAFLWESRVNGGYAATQSDGRMSVIPSVVSNRFEHLFVCQSMTTKTAIHVGFICILIRLGLPIVSLCNEQAGVFLDGNLLADGSVLKIGDAILQPAEFGEHLPQGYGCLVAHGLLVTAILMRHSVSGGPEAPETWVTVRNGLGEASVNEFRPFVETWANSLKY